MREPEALAPRRRPRRRAARRREHGLVNAGRRVAPQDARAPAGEVHPQDPALLRAGDVEDQRGRRRARGGRALGGAAATRAGAPAGSGAPRAAVAALPANHRVLRDRHLVGAGGGERGDHRAGRAIGSRGSRRPTSTATYGPPSVELVGPRSLVAGGGAQRRRRRRAPSSEFPAGDGGVGCAGARKAFVCALALSGAERDRAGAERHGVGRGKPRRIAGRPAMSSVARMPSGVSASGARATTGSARPTPNARPTRARGRVADGERDAASAGTAKVSTKVVKPRPSSTPYAAAASGSGSTRRQCSGTWRRICGTIRRRSPRPARRRPPAPRRRASATRRRAARRAARASRR